jgi:DNA-directed RNA polymerase III subunit RPC2
MKNLLYSFLFSKGIIWQQIESFDSFLKSDLKKILNTKEASFFFPNSIYKIVYSSIKINNAVVLRKDFEYSVTPFECRQRDITYSSQIFVNLKLKYSGKILFLNNFSLCRIPLMLQSKNCLLSRKNGSFLKSIKECSIDPGGYFIIKGAEKIILLQEQLTLNRIFIEHDFQGNPCVTTTTKINSLKLKNSILLKNRKLFFRHKIFLEDIPIIILFRYFGFGKNEDIRDLIGKEYENLLKPSLRENKLNNIVTKNQAVFYLSKRVDEKFLKKKNEINKQSIQKYSIKTNEIIIKLIDENILIKDEKKGFNSIFNYDKAIWLSIMVRRIFIGINRSDYTNTKDYYGNKRVELVGDLLGILFDDLFNRANKEFKKQLILAIERRRKENFFDLDRIFKTDIISNGIEMAFITGNWSIKKYRLQRSGISQIISRANQLSCLSNLTKIVSSSQKRIKGSGPRALNSSQWGLICPSDTPEGESCGLVKSLTLLAHISTKENSRFLKWLAQNLGVDSKISFHPELLFSFEKTSTVFIDGEFIGFHSFPPKLLYSIRSLRRVGLLGKYISIFWDSILKSVTITSDSGRICRPLIIVKYGKTKLKEKEIISKKKVRFFWKDFIRDGCMEFLDTNEENNAFIASTKNKINLETTHIELSPLIILGVSASTIPLCNHNQSPRNTYQCSMGKQAAGVVSLNQNDRTDTILSILSYPQKSLVKTKTLNLLGVDKLPTGTNSYVCIMSYSGYDLEDSIILNKESILRGFSRTILLRKHKILCKGVNLSKNTGYLEEINKIFGEKVLKSNDFNKNEIFPNCPNFSKLNFSNLENQKKTITPNKIRKNWMIKNAIYTNDVNGIHFIKLILRQVRKPEIGDKFSSRHGQKGVCGLICPQENLPFSSNGLIPDLIMNPHGFPSRMTIGKLIEIISGKNCLFRGNFFNGTAFIGKDIMDFKKILKNIGFSSNGKEFLICGLTGKPLRQEIFCGPVYYQRLKHMVKDKIHARSRGSRSCLTRQPTEGRSKGGGLRFGEMERDCVIGFGCSELLTERLMISSDVFIANFDFHTGFMATEEITNQNIRLKLPYACKLLFQELQSMNIKPKLNLKNGKFSFSEF